MEFDLIYNNETRTVDIPTSWDEVPFHQYCKLIVADVEGLSFEKRLLVRLQIFTSISEEDLKQCTSQTIVNLTNLVKFSFSYKDLEKANVVPEQYKNFDPAEEKWGKFEEARQAMQDKKTEAELFCCGDKVVKAFTDEDITDRPITEVYGLVNFFLVKSISSWETMLHSGNRTTRRTKSPRESKSVLRHSGFFRHFIHLLRETHSISTRSSTSKPE